MRRRLVTVLGFAVLAAFVASTVLYRLITLRTQQPPKAASATVWVAARDLPVGALVSLDDVRLVAWPGAVSASWVGTPEELVGRGVVSPVNAGEPFPQNRLALKGTGAGLAAVIPAGMRAVAIKVDEVVGVSGFVLPGMRVDVLSSGSPPGNTGVVTRTILQNIEVLSAGRNTERDPQGKPAAVQVVNLLVTPEQAEALSLASGQTKIQLVMRNLLDTAQAHPQGISMNQLLLGQPVTPRSSLPRLPKSTPPVPQPAPAQPAPAPRVEKPKAVEVFNGNQKTLVRISDAEREYQQ